MSADRQASAGGGDFTVGVEEEFQLVAAATGRLRQRAAGVLDEAGEALGGSVKPELQRSQVETSTAICATLAELRTELERLRRELARVADERGLRIAAVGTHPLSSLDDHRITPKERYLRMADAFGLVAREQLVCACHVHVGISDRELAIQAMNRSRPWLSPLLALAANSPFWRRVDTGYASYRTQLWSRWPTAGPPGLFASRAEYDAVCRRLIASGVAFDLGMIYFDIRPSRNFDTLEFRVADVCMSIDEAVMIAGLTRALARTSAWAVLNDEPVEHPRYELLKAAHWTASRYGLEGHLVDTYTGHAVPAGDLVRRLVSHVRPALEDCGEDGEVSALVEQTLRRGNGAARQRVALERRGSLEDVVDLVVAETLPPPI
ncbi:MAG: glutamate--cysteine ligase [Actinomycetota bacterium]|nr:glutamate--cysteine ligase [Actinomycetota bacterium]